MFADNTGLNAICLICNDGKEICSAQGDKGTWHEDIAHSSSGFKGFEIQFQDKQGAWDDTAVNNIGLHALDGQWKKLNLNMPGEWVAIHGCKPGYIICGLKTRVEASSWYNTDDTALNGVIFRCCEMADIHTP